MAAPSKGGREFQNYINRLKAAGQENKRRKKEEYNKGDALRQKLNSRVSPIRYADGGVEAGGNRNRWNEGRLNTDNDDDYKRWVNMVDMKNMVREADRRRYMNEQAEKRKKKW